MAHSVYSFNDTVLTLKSKHLTGGSLTITGQGVGSVGVTRANDNTQHDVAADGSVMASKITVKNGALSITVQQTSPAHLELIKWLKALQTAKTDDWIETTGTLKNSSTGEDLDIQGISPQKRPDLTLQTSGQQVTWNLMATEING